MSRLKALGKVLGIAGVLLSFYAYGYYTGYINAALLVCGEEVREGYVQPVKVTQ